MRLAALPLSRPPFPMSLPPDLRASVTPPELELIACQQLVEIIPLVSMERTAFISVR